MINFNLSLHIDIKILRRKQFFRIMRISLLFLFLCTTLLFAENLHSQKAKVTINQRNVNLGTVLEEIENQTDYLFLYNSNQINMRRNVSVNVKNVQVGDLLTKLFEDTPVKAVMEGTHIVLLADGNETPASEVAQQTLNITGTVTDANGETLPGANISVKGTTIGVTTGVDGKYSITVPDGNRILVFSYIGFISQEIVVAGREIIDVTLNEDIMQIDEVVVVGYGTQKKVNLTGSVASVTSADLINKPVATTSQAIAGLAPGLSVVQNSGRPGTSATVRIRGTGTFSSAGTAPLVLIDGLSGNIDDVDPNDVESISFLKDAASAAIYGNRAANGVILIETKKGTDGKIRINYSNSFGWQKPTELPDFLPSWEYATYYNEAMANMGRAEAYSAETIQKYQSGSDPDNYPNVNHLEWLLNTGSGFQQRHSLNVQGGNATTNYNISVGYMEQNGMTEQTTNKRYTALLSLKTKLTNTLTLNTSINAFANNNQTPNGEPTSIDGIIGYAVREPPIIPGKKSDGSFGYQDNYSPEAWLASTSFHNNLRRNVNAFGQLLWNTPIEGLVLSGKAGLTYYTNNNKSFRANTYFDDSKTVGPATLSISSGMDSYTTLEALATYDKQIKSHSLKILAGTSRELSENRSLSGDRNTFPNNYLYELSAGDASTSSNSSSLSEYALVSVFGRINYSFNDRYLLEANFRYDGSSRFSRNTRWGFFPSFSAGWRISEERFWKDSDLNNIINQLKIRVSWGVLGNQNIGTYPYQQTYSTGQTYPIGNPATLMPGVRINSFNNPEITWETTSITDIGLDFSLLKGTISGTVDYFNKYTDNILAAVQRANIMGRSVGQSNIGAVSNKGIEAILAYNGKIGKYFRLSVAPNFTYIKNAVEQLADGALEDINNSRIVGQPIGIIYGYTTDGLFVDQKEIDDAPEQLVGKSGIRPGYVKYVDISGPDGKPEGQVNATYDRMVIGCTNPKFYYGLNITASFKGFDFSMLMQGLGGHQRRIGSYMAYAFYNNGQIQRWQVDNRWTTANPDKWAKYPRLETLNMNSTNLQTSDYWVKDASFLRVKNVQIGYALPKSFTKQIGIENARVYVSGQNLYNFKSFYQGWDPENEISTGDAPSFYPINSIYAFGFNFSF